MFLSSWVVVLFNFLWGLRYLEVLSWVESKTVSETDSIQLFLFLMCRIGVGFVLYLVQVENREQDNKTRS